MNDPLIYIFFPLITCQLDIVLILWGEIMSSSPWGVKKLHFINCTLRKHQWTVINFLFSFSFLLSSPSIVGKKIGKWEDPKAARGCVVLFVIGLREEGEKKSWGAHGSKLCEQSFCTWALFFSLLQIHLVFPHIQARRTSSSKYAFINSWKEILAKF